MSVSLLQGDCIEVMANLEDESIDSIVSDPPYGLEFMGKGWDSFGSDLHLSMVAFGEWCEQWGRQAYRILKPGGCICAFSGSRTYHRLTVGLEDAGFLIEGCALWLYATGFPKSLDVAKAIDKGEGIWRGRAGEQISGNTAMAAGNYERTDKGSAVTNDAQVWEGWGTALKPAWEPIVVGRKS